MGSPECSVLRCQQPAGSTNVLRTPAASGEEFDRVCDKHWAQVCSGSPFRVDTDGDGRQIYLDTDLYVDETWLLNQSHPTPDVVFWSEALDKGEVFPVIEMSVFVAKGKEQTIRVALSKQQVDELRQQLNRIPHFDAE